MSAHEASHKHAAHRARENQRGVISVAMLEKQDNLRPSDVAVLKSVNPLGYKRYLKRQERLKEKEVRFARLEKLRDEILERQEQISKVERQIEQTESANTALAIEHEAIVGELNTRISSILSWTEGFDNTYTSHLRKGIIEGQAKKKETDRARDEGERTLAILRSVLEQKTSRYNQLSSDLSALLSFHPSSPLSDTQRSSELRHLAEEIKTKRNVFEEELKESEREVERAKERIERREGERVEIVAERVRTHNQHHGELLEEIGGLREEASRLKKLLSEGSDDRRDLIALAKNFRCDPNENPGLGGVREVLRQKAGLVHETIETESIRV
ncbi:hypothetical protein M427DRAFT_507739 [Gonapodya prolifera JEL478]|uniref:Uncharacterized protein n=1 Tax=Gonapodya prolifera (strain JEL478) TaxID=1344416 RepID=A0A139AQZ9_GONPJ|nr:hypothetical protein M427DRAFT_507739 [Gonapodya prolifera JEL478]|eukprot:KXS19156.1 hypothetical protein M427DRAFT_507739 [Gonapodya prolifera JEL478]